MVTRGPYCTDKSCLPCPASTPFLVQTTFLNSQPRLGHNLPHQFDHLSSTPVRETHSRTSVSVIMDNVEPARSQLLSLQPDPRLPARANAHNLGDDRCRPEFRNKLCAPLNNIFGGFVSHFFVAVFL